MMPLEVQKVRVSLNKKFLLRELNLSFEEGRLYGILGPNGAGKSTFLKTLAGLLSHYEGKVVLLGKDLKDYSLKELGKLRSYLPQRNGTLPNLTVWETLLFGRIPHLNFEIRKEDLNLVEKLIDRLGLSELSTRKLSELSGGELQKVLLGRALAQEPKFLLLDEPINHLDPKNKLEILKLVREETIKNKLVTLLVLHDINLALKFCDFLLLIKEGSLKYFGHRDEIESTILSEVFDINIKFLEEGNQKFVIYY